ncbi:unnamed protein product [Leptidea sinapis]|uniref:Uncharacterized protein n=1 Tax=Leptidea sinapis TaxID=189913 RepID=A0A5E4PUY0_9NEOP|nr:unnamed protein product [Leptidea sinapis]
MKFKKIFAFRIHTRTPSLWC